MRRFAGALAVVSIMVGSVAGSVAMADPHFDGGRQGGEWSHRDWRQDGRWDHDHDRGQERHDFERGHWDHDRDRWDHDRDRWDHDRDHWDRDRWDHDHWDHGRWDRDHWRFERAPIVEYRPYDHDWRPSGWVEYRRGDRLPVVYYSRPYVIENYHGCGLYAPPVGYHWVRVNGDAVLAAVATGIILDAVYHAF